MTDYNINLTLRVILELIGAIKDLRIFMSDLSRQTICDKGNWNINPLLVLHIWNKLCPHGYTKRINKSLDTGHPGHFEPSPFSKRNYTPHTIIK